MFQYPKLTHTTLPSVVGGFGTMQIVRDPPKGISTRYIKKVGEDNDILDWKDDAGSGSRACEFILPFARGINPSVSVDYSNNGTNGGQYRDIYGANSSSKGVTRGAAYLPYHFNNTNFRPPILTQRELLPLSRLPRVNLGEINTTKSSDMTILDRLLECPTDLRQVRDSLKLHLISARPTFIYEKATPLKPSEIATTIKDTLKGMFATNKSGISGSAASQNIMPDKGVNYNKLYSQVTTTPYKNIQTTPLDHFLPATVQAVQNRTPLCGNMSTNNKFVGQGMGVAPQNEITLTRNTPLTSMTVNCGTKMVDMNADINSRNAYLPPRTNRGGFSNYGVPVRT